MKFSVIPLSVQHALRAGAARNASDKAMDKARDARSAHRVFGELGAPLGMVAHWTQIARAQRSQYRHWLKAAMRERDLEAVQARVEAIRRIRSEPRMVVDLSDFHAMIGTLSKLSIMQKQAD